MKNSTKQQKVAKAAQKTAKPAQTFWKVKSGKGGFFNSRRSKSSSKSRSKETRRRECGRTKIKVEGQMGAQKGGGPEGVKAQTQKKWGGAKGGGAWRAGPERPRRGEGGGKISSSFFFLPPEIWLFMLSLGVFSWNFGGVWSAGALQNGRLGSLGHRVKKIEKIKHEKYWSNKKNKKFWWKKKTKNSKIQKITFTFYFLFLIFLFWLFLKIIFVFLSFLWCFLDFGHSFFVSRKKKALCIPKKAFVSTQKTLYPKKILCIPKKVFGIPN